MSTTIRVQVAYPVGVTQADRPVGFQHGSGEGGDPMVLSCSGVCSNSSQQAAGGRPVANRDYD
jgi:hypothetical protein